MKKILSMVLAMMLLLTACNSGNPSSSSSISSSESSSSQVSSEVSSSSEISSSALEVSSSVSTPTTVNSSSSSETVAVSSKASEVPATLTPAEKFKDEKYHLTTPATKSWKKAYDTFYQGYIQDIVPFKNSGDLSDDYEVRDNLYYRQFILDGNKSLCYEDIMNFHSLIEKASENPEIIMQKYTSVGHLFAVAQNKSDKKYAGEAGFFVNGRDIILNEISFFEEGKYDYRTSMTITEGVENQLLAAGFKPETTEAYALSIPLNTYGVFFIDGKNAAFYPSSDGLGWAIPYGVLYTIEDVANNIKNSPIQIIPPPSENLNPATGKPVIYLYPERETKVNVKVSYPEDFSYTYPQYNKKYGWQVTAYPDGRLVDSGNNEYYYLFWEGNAKLDWDMSKGFVVNSVDTETFLEEKLTYLGLNARERNDFITYWAPEMRENAYNLIHFSTTQYNELAKMTVTPSPSTTIRVHMVYKPCQKNTTVTEQVLIKAPKRSGFTVVEWGGTRAHY